MSKIAEHIEQINQKNEKALTAFITAGFPTKEHFVELGIAVFEAGADIIEIGVPFSDPLAEGPVIQHSSQTGLENGVTIADTFDYAKEIKTKVNKPIILMGYANPVMKYGVEKYVKKAIDSGVDGLIIPDLPVEEFIDFFGNSLEQNGLDGILLTTPTSTEERINMIDKTSTGFVYCVSVTGTTGVRDSFNDDTLKNLERTYAIINNNKMQIGFGISTPERVKQFAPYCDGVIVGSAIIKSLMNDEAKNGDFTNTVNLIKSLKEACKIE